MQRKRHVFCTRPGIAYLAVLLPLGLAGCPRTLQLPPDPPFKGAVVRVACPSSPALPADIVRRQARVWAARQQARVEVVRYDPNAAFAPRRGPEQGEKADVWIMRPSELGKWAASDKV